MSGSDLDYTAQCILAAIRSDPVDESASEQSQQTEYISQRVGSLLIAETALSLIAIRKMLESLGR